ncbi:MlaD family protein [Limnohabitans sp.]|uniref:MlaD family protein n=1 Tax=Limnohabitans sp. TaxID=1907725 RepID=UPI0038B823CC
MNMMARKASSLWLSVVLVGVAGGLLMAYVAQRKAWFEPRAMFTFETDSGHDLFLGMKLSYKGFKIGQLTELVLLPNGQVQGQISVPQDKANFVTQGAVLKVAKDKIVSSELLLQPAPGDTQVLPRGAKLALMREDMAADLTKKIDPLLERVHVLLGQLSDPRLGVQASLVQSRQTMQQTSGTLQEAAVFLKETQQTLQSFQPLTQQATTTLQELEKSLAQTRTTMGQTQALIEQLKDPQTGLAATVSQTRSALEDAGKLMQNVDGTLTDIQSAPVYRWLVPNRSAPTLPPK